jgi:hypothetical protein
MIVKEKYKNEYGFTEENSHGKKKIGTGFPKNAKK